MKNITLGSSPEKNVLRGKDHICLTQAKDVSYLSPLLMQEKMTLPVLTFFIKKGRKLGKLIWTACLPHTCLPHI